MSILGCRHISLIESDKKKCVFLREVKRTLSLDCQVLESRVEEIENLSFDLIVSRAMADIDRIFFYSGKIMTKETKIILFKGKSYLSEIKKANQNWSFETQITKSKTNPDAVLIEFSNVSLREN